MNSLNSHFPASLLPARSREFSSSLSSRRTAPSNLSWFCSLPFPQQIGLAFSPLRLIEKKPHLLSFIAPKAVIESVDTDKPKVAHAKFILQRTCNFGEQYLLVGDDPLLGSWDPTNAVSLNWSAGHIWTADLDLPVGKIIQFKFILKSSLGQAIWQPGPDRSWKVCDTGNTIFICNDWEDPQKLTITEEWPKVIPEEAEVPSESKFGIHGKAPVDVNREEEKISENETSNDLDSIEENTSAEKNVGNRNGDENDPQQTAKLKTIEEGPVLVPGLAYNNALKSGGSDKFNPQQQGELEVPRGSLVEEEATRALEKHGEHDEEEKDGKI